MFCMMFLMLFVGSILNPTPFFTVRKPTVPILNPKGKTTSLQPRFGCYILCLGFTEGKGKRGRKKGAILGWAVVSNTFLGFVEVIVYFLPWYGILLLNY